MEFDVGITDIEISSKKGAFICLKIYLTEIGMILNNISILYRIVGSYKGINSSGAYVWEGHWELMLPNKSNAENELSDFYQFIELDDKNDFLSMILDKIRKKSNTIEFIEERYKGKD